LPGSFAVATDGIYFASADDASRRFEVNFYSFASKRKEAVARIEGGFGNGMALATDGRSLVFPIEQHTGDLVMVEDFR
jgi:hypothetical protein